MRLNHARRTHRNALRHGGAFGQEVFCVKASDRRALRINQAGLDKVSTTGTSTKQVEVSAGTRQRLLLPPISERVQEPLGCAFQIIDCLLQQCRCVAKISRIFGARILRDLS